MNSARENQERIAGDAQSGLRIEAGGWNGWITVDIYAIGDEDRVRVYMTEHPHHEQEHMTTLFEGPLLAKDAYENQKKTMRRRASREAGRMFHDRMHRSNVPVTGMAEDDPFYIDGSEADD